MLLERRDQPGGRAYVYRQDGFVFDGGPTVITAPFLFEELWSLCGRRLADDVELRPVTPFYRIRFHDGAQFDYTGDPEAMRRGVAALAPGDVDGYERFLDTGRRGATVGFEQLAQPFSSWTDMARIVPEMMQLKATARSTAWSRPTCTTNGYGRCCRSTRCWWAFETTSIYSLITTSSAASVCGSRWGTGALVRGLVGLMIESQGNRVRLQRRGLAHRRGDGRARGIVLADSSRIDADIIDLERRCRLHLQAPAAGRSRRKHWTDARVDRARYSMTCSY
ncbi:MAG: FAD-dependent oxidoreductase [Nannocystaceae bacterium]